ncbi:MAG: hypothetical protein FJY85_06920, partial [Deltaproteobacteria bacterium]|nr:hypothetical protein [Deltaproteobacteria bacterium]
GSGVSAIEAIRSGRRAIVCDLLPVATEIIRLTLKPVDTNELLDAFGRVEELVKERILGLYVTRCRGCKKAIAFDCAIWVGDECREIRYEKCPYCGDRREKNTPPTAADKNVLKHIQARKIKEWYPAQRLYYPNGEPFKEKQKYESLDELFTKRNLQALAWLMEAIEKESNKTLRDFLKIAFTSMVHLCSRMMPVRPTRPLSGVWFEHSYWYPSGPYMEQNVWEKFESAVADRQGIVRAKEESNRHFEGVRFATSFDEVVSRKADVFIHTGPCQDLMNEMAKEYPDGCVDYIFTDPPYAASIQYGELAFLWVAWLKQDHSYLGSLLANEVVENKKQGKGFAEYESFLRGTMQQMYQALKPNRWTHLTFHNPTFKVRNATLRCGVFAGFEFQHIHHQELARPSAKSLLQPFGSAQGDFYIRFHKPPHKGKAFQEQIDEKRFERVVLNTALRVIAERGEETPYTVLVNAIDPELVRNGFFRRLPSGMDVETVLKNHIGQEFCLVPVHIGSAKGKAWWLQDPTKYRIDVVPLSERVEQTVLRQLQQHGRLTFTDVWDAVSSDFPNALTTDSTTIKEALALYADPVKGGGTRGIWRIKDEAREANIEREHSEIIAMLAQVGQRNGYEIWIGRPEQAHAVPLTLGKGSLGQWVTVRDLRTIKDLANPSSVELIDVLWLARGQVLCAFEVEATTAMTEALNRGSNLPKEIPKYLVLPQSRKSLLERKLRSPLFAEHFKEELWRVIYFEKLRKEFQKQR